MEILEILEDLKKWGKNRKKNPYFSENHRFGSELRELLSYHAEFGVFPTKLINSAAPNEDPAEFRYRKENYKQVTKPYWDKALGVTYRIFNPQNYSIAWGSDEIKDYFLNTYPKIGSYLEQFKDVTHKMKFSDPNAVTVVRPEFIPGEMKMEDDVEVFVVDQSIPVTPISVIYTADKVFEFESDMCLVLTDEHSEVFIADKKKQEGLIFEYYDSMSIYKIVQYGNQNDWTFNVIEYYQHNWEQMPCWKLKGIPYYDTEDILYWSYFQAALPNLDEAAVLNSTSFGVINKIAFPTRWYYEDSCGTCSGSGKETIYNEGEPEVSRCSSCNGTGHKMTWSFGKDYIIPMPENNVSADSTTLPTPPFGVVDPPVESIRFLDEKVKHLLESSFLNLNISTTDRPTGVTATEKSIDEDELITFLMQISSEEFYLLQEIINAHVYMMGSDVEVVVKKPTEFRIRSSADLTAELKTAADAKLPATYQFKLLEENIQQRFQNDKVMEQMLKITALVDPFMTLDNLTIGSLTNTGTVPKWWATLHYSIYNFLAVKLEDNPNYLETDIKIITKDMQTMAQEALPVSGNKAVDILGGL